MRFVVLGAGAIGAYVGAALARGGADVTLIARGAHLQAMTERGVQVLSPRGDFTAHRRLPTSSRRSPKPTWCSSRSRRTACPRSLGAWEACSPPTRR